MATRYVSHVTAEPGGRASLGAHGPENASGPAGIWTLSGAGLAVADHDGPATVVVPGEAVRLIAVDLPLASRAKRLAALPFAVEDQIAEGMDAVHLALGEELSPKRYLVGVVRHDRMAEWIARIEDAGLDHAALVPDALALPRPAEGEWTVDLGETRAVVRAGDGTGFAVAAPMLRTAWEAAGRPRIASCGAPLPADMGADVSALEVESLGRRLLVPALDLRQGAYARRRRSLPSYAKRLVQVLAIGAIAHAGIATADTILLRRIADSKAAETRALVATMAPGAALPEDDLAGGVADLLPKPGAGGGSNAFLPGAARVSAALAPLSAEVAARSMVWQGDSVTVDLTSADPALAQRVRRALTDAGVRATVTTPADGIRIVVPAA